jgi:nucleoside 2-deoxyribosyltransferase
MKIYFAHPAFTPEQINFKQEFLQKLQERFETNGIARRIPTPEIIDPFSFTGNIGNRNLDRAISFMDCRLLATCSLILALTDHDDTGVAFELGFAYAQHIPAILISEDQSAHKANAMLTGAANAIIGDILETKNMQALTEVIHGFIGSSSGLECRR